jgi:hypothetical protein
LRYVVRFKGNPPPITDRMTGERAIKRLNARFKDLQTTLNKFSVVATLCKPSRNYAVTFANNTPAVLAEEHKEQLLHVLAPQQHHAVVSSDDPWVNVIVHAISLHDDNSYHDRTKAYWTRYA